MDVPVPSRDRLRGVPFRRRPWLAAVVALGLFAAVFVLRLSVHGTRDHITSFYVLAIALVALAFGFRAGALAGVFAVLLVVAGAVVEGTSFSPLGWFSRAVPLLLLGMLLGQASDRLRSTVATEEALFASRLRAREAAEINDSIIQRLAAAKWSLEAGQIECGLEALTETIQTSEALVVALLRSEPFHHGTHDDGERDIRSVAGVNTPHIWNEPMPRSTRPSPALATPTDPAT